MFPLFKKLAGSERPQKHTDHAHGGGCCGGGHSDQHGGTDEARRGDPLEPGASGEQSVENELAPTSAGSDHAHA